VKAQHLTQKKKRLALPILSVTDQSNHRSVLVGKNGHTIPPVYM